MSSVTEPGSKKVPIVEPLNNSEKVPLEDSRKDEFVDFGGIKLPKGTGKETKVPKKMEAFIEDEFTLDLQKSLAQAFKLHQPINIEGGSSLGKTTIIRDMAAQLGWSLHSINLQGMTEVSDLMGRLTVNPDKKSASEPEFIWVDGPVSAAIREASMGNKVILLLDEYNIADPDVLIRLHEVIDRYEDSDDFILTEHNDERLRMIKENLFIVAASNPPSRGNSEYAGRKPLDRAQFRRWVYKRLPDELPPESFEAFVHNVFSRLGDEPWVGELADAFIGFHTEAISMIKNSEIGEDLPQPISYDMREEPVRVADFIKEFTDDLFGGNINLAMQSALIFYYADKILDEEERQKILE